MDENSIAEYLTSKSTNIYFSTKMSNTQKSNIHISPSIHINILEKKYIGYKNLPLTPITRYKNLLLNPITWFQLKTFKKCFITMKIDFKHENVWRPLKMNNQSLGLAFLETRNTPRQKWNLKLLKLLWEDSIKKIKK